MAVVSPEVVVWRAEFGSDCRCDSRNFVLLSGTHNNPRGVQQYPPRTPAQIFKRIFHILN